MFAALSATNEAIMRAKSRTELFELVCEAAANGGKFTSTTIALAKPDSDQLDIVAAAGPTAETTRTVTALDRAARPEGRGLAAPRSAPGSPASATIIWLTSEPVRSTPSFAATGQGRARRFRC